MVFWGLGALRFQDQPLAASRWPMAVAVAGAPAPVASDGHGPRVDDLCAARCDSPFALWQVAKPM